MPQHEHLLRSGGRRHNRSPRKAAVGNVVFPTAVNERGGGLDAYYGMAKLTTCWLSRTEEWLPVWDHTTGNGIDSRLGPADQAQLAQYVAHVPLDRALTHVQVARNLLVAAPLR